MPRSGSATREFLELAVSVLDQHFGVPFHFCDRQSLEPISAGAPGWLSQDRPAWLTDIARQPAGDSRSSVHRISDAVQALVIPLSRGHEAELLAIGFFATRPLAGPDAEDVSRWLGDGRPGNQLPFCQAELLERLGEEVVRTIHDRHQSLARAGELKQLASQLSRNYEEITLLHQLTRASQVSQTVRELQELTITLLADILPVRQLAYVDARSENVMSAGESILAADECHELIGSLELRGVQNVLVENHLSQRGLKPHFAEVQRMIRVAVVEGKELFGWLLALGTTDGVELGTVEASLMTAAGAILATHQTNVKLFGNIKELFLGVVRALSSAIDAKDPYTCGHSERVARLSRRLAQELGLSEDERNRVYLSGLLHDVGKIGIRDSVLLKPGRLTPEEIAHIQQHPKIGFDILSGVKQLKAVLAGVRSHHESFEGTGYPDRLKGEEIPLMARIVAVADAYDAMSSNRPYRQGLDRKRIERILRDGAGKQWDGRVVDALLSIHESEPRGESEKMTERGIALGGLTDNPDLGRFSRIISLSACPS